jgi:hypothetical protein
MAGAAPLDRDRSESKEMMTEDSQMGLERRGAETRSYKNRKSLRLCVSASKSLIIAILLSVFAAGQQPASAVPAGDAFGSRRSEAQSAREGHRAKLFVDLAHQEMEAADRAFTEGNVELGQKLAADAGSDADEAGKAALESGKRLKDTEIDLRKLQTRTRDIGRSLSFDDRPPMTKIVDRIEAMREAILNRMFGGKKGKP